MEFSGEFLGVVLSALGGSGTMLAGVRWALREWQKKDEEIARLRQTISDMKDAELERERAHVRLLQEELRETERLRTHVTQSLPSSPPPPRG